MIIVSNNNRLKIFNLLNFKDMCDKFQTFHGGKQLDCSSFHGKIKQYGELATVLLLVRTSPSGLQYSIFIAIFTFYYLDFYDQHVSRLYYCDLL